jgi:heavy metal sensor kinase
MRRLSIRARLTAWYVLLLALILTAFSLVLYAALSDRLARSLDDRLRLEAEALASSLGQGEIKIEDEGDEGRSLQLPSSDFLIRLLDKKGREASASDALRGAPIGAAALDAARRGGAFYTVSLNDDSQARAFLIPLLHEGKEIIGFLEVAEPLAVVETTQRNLALILIVAVPATLALASVGGLFIADRALRPIDTITREAQRIGEQHLDRRLNLDLPDDEVGRLARTLDDMLARLDAAFQRQRRFTADASHELRTPLTVMKGSIGVTLNRPRSVEDYQAALAQLEGEVDRLTRLAEDLLLLARADAGRPLIQPREIDLVGVTRSVLTALRPLAEAKSLAIQLDAPETLTMPGDPDRLTRMISNLVENAIKYTQRGYVDVRIEKTPGNSQVRLAVTDTGPGIAAEHVPHLFKRFYRADEARSREPGGSGLGLAIAHGIAIAHGGAIEVESRVGVGTTVVVTLPVTP